MDILQAIAALKDTVNDRLLAHRNGSLGSIITIFAGVPRKRPLPVVQMENGALGIFPVKRGSQLGENLIEWPHMGEMDLGAWFHAVFGHWQNWLSGSGIGGVVTIAVGVLSSLKLWTMPRKWYAITFIGFFFIGANYMAWHDAYSSMKGRESDLRQSRVELDTEKQTSQSLRSQLTELKETKIEFHEPPDSLRRRINKLVAEVEVLIRHAVCGVDLEWRLAMQDGR
jgi:hypothetical protein